MRRNMMASLGAGVVIAAAWACGRGQGDAAQAAADTAKRNLALAPAESASRPINDRPLATTAEPRVTRKSAPPPKPEALEETKAPPKEESPAPQPPPPMLTTGTNLSVSTVDSINTGRNHKGDPVTATLGEDVKDSLGRTVIPAGAVLTGTVSDIDAGHPGSPGRILVTFSRVQFRGKSYGITAHVDSMATVEKGRSVGTTEAAKVGVGAVLGGIAGRLIGGNKTGTIVGGAAGAAAGAGVAAKTRNVDVILPAGAYVRLSLTAPFDRRELQ